MAEAERIKPRAIYESEAIQHALEAHWAEAAATNRAVLERYGPDEDAQNRLGKALLELGQLEDAVLAYQKSLELNPLNLIAQKNVKKIQAMLEVPDRVGATTGGLDVALFSEEPGKSALTELVAPSGGVSITVVPGDKVILEIESQTVHARTARGVALGDLDPRIVRRLLPLIHSGNRYAAAVARVQDDKIEVMVRESYQAPENVRKTSFPVSRGGKAPDFRAYARESLLAQRGIDDDAFDSGDDENLPGAQDEAGVPLPGMHDADDDIETAGVADVEDDDDDDAADDSDSETRPEDEY